LINIIKTERGNNDFAGDKTDVSNTPDICGNQDLIAEDTSHILGDIISEEDAINLLKSNEATYSKFLLMDKKYQDLIILFMTGRQSIKITYDPIFKKTFDIYFVIPPDLNFNLYCNGAIYMGADLDVKTSNMPSDWSSLTLDKINCSASGTVFINGKNSYRAEINKLGVANSEGSFDGTLYGNKGAFLFSGTAYAKLIENGYLDYLIDFDNAKAYGNLINKLNSKKNAQNGTDCYFVGKDEIQLTMNGNTVTFSDGTVMNSSEVFVEKNFPKTSKSLLTKLEELLEMFGLDW